MDQTLPSEVHKNDVSHTNMELNINVTKEKKKQNNFIY